MTCRLQAVIGINYFLNHFTVVKYVVSYIDTKVLKLPWSNYQQVVNYFSTTMPPISKKRESLFTISVKQEYIHKFNQW